MVCEAIPFVRERVGASFFCMPPLLSPSLVDRASLYPYRRALRAVCVPASADFKPTPPPPSNLFPVPQLKPYRPPGEWPPPLLRSCRAVPPFARKRLFLGRFPPLLRRNLADYRRRRRPRPSLLYVKSFFAIGLYEPVIQSFSVATPSLLPIIQI